MKKKQNIVPLKDLSLTDRFAGGHHLWKRDTAFRASADGKGTQGIAPDSLDTDGCICNERGAEHL